MNEGKIKGTYHSRWKSGGKILFNCHHLIKGKTFPDSTEGTQDKTNGPLSVIMGFDSH